MSGNSEMTTICANSPAIASQRHAQLHVGEPPQLAAGQGNRDDREQRDEDEQHVVTAVLSRVHALQREMGMFKIRLLIGR